MKSKEAKSSELAQIVKQPYNPKIAEQRKKKEEVVLYAYFR